MFDICKKLHFIHYLKRTFWSNASIVIGSGIPAHTTVLSKKNKNKKMLCFDWEHIAGILSSSFPGAGDKELEEFCYILSLLVSNDMQLPGHQLELHTYTFTPDTMGPVSWFGAGLSLKLVPAEPLWLLHPQGWVIHYLCICASFCAGILLGKVLVLLRMETASFQIILFPWDFFLWNSLCLHVICKHKFQHHWECPWPGPCAWGLCRLPFCCSTPLCNPCSMAFWPQVWSRWWLSSLPK